MEEVAELTILAMVMFLAAFFCYRVILLPDASNKSIKKIHEIENILSENK